MHERCNLADSLVLETAAVKMLMTKRVRWNVHCFLLVFGSMSCGSDDVTPCYEFQSNVGEAYTFLAAQLRRWNRTFWLYIAILCSSSSCPQKASELRELVSSCERQRALHCKLLAVVLGGCISTALRCVEEARRRNKTINVPLFDQLLENLCKGSLLGVSFNFYTLITRSKSWKTGFDSCKSNSQGLANALNIVGNLKKL